MKTRRNQHGGNTPNIFKTSNISTQTTLDPGYKVVGVLTHTINSGISAVREMATSLSNVFGQSGFDTSKFNTAKNRGLTAISEKLGLNQKLIGLTIDVDNSPKLICVHFTGTIIEKL